MLGYHSDHGQQDPLLLQQIFQEEVSEQKLNNALAKRSGLGR